MSVCQMRWASTKSGLKVVKIDKNISFRPAAERLENGQQPLVIMYSWLVAKAKHIYK